MILESFQDEGGARSLSPRSSNAFGAPSTIEPTPYAPTRPAPLSIARPCCVGADFDFWPPDTSCKLISPGQ